MKAFEGRKVRTVGFLTAQGGNPKLVRWIMWCCAADARARTSIRTQPGESFPANWKRETPMALKLSARRNFLPRSDMSFPESTSIPSKPRRNRTSRIFRHNRFGSCRPPGNGGQNPRSEIAGYHSQPSFRNSDSIIASPVALFDRSLICRRNLEWSRRAHDPRCLQLFRGIQRPLYRSV